MTIGIELEAPGLLARHGDAWIHPDTGHEVIDVFVDDRGRGWGKISDCQFATLGALLDRLGPQLSPAPIGTCVHIGTYADNACQRACRTRCAHHQARDQQPDPKTDPVSGVMTYQGAGERDSEEKWRAYAALLSLIIDDADR